MSRELFTPFDRPVALCLGGMDPSAGAGVLRDVTSLASLGVFSMAIPLAETVQNGMECCSIEPPSVSPLLRLEAIKPHLKQTWGLKMGMCHLALNDLALLWKALLEMLPRVCIWDPIKAPTQGVALHTDTHLAAVAKLLLGEGSWVVTPNRLEAASLAGLSDSEAEKADPLDLAAPFLGLGARAVWLKGGHASGDRVEDYWITKDQVLSLGSYTRLSGERRGTGCTLAALWLAYRLQGEDDVSSACLAAKYLRSHWDVAFSPGQFGRPCFLPGNV